MKTICPLLFSGFIFLICLTSCYNYYYVVRHADKAADVNPDTATPLSNAGTQRALALRDSLSNKNIKKIYVSEYLRTQQTAAPTATQHGITPIQYHLATAPAPELTTLVSELRATEQNVLLVGHTNNIPQVIEGLTGGTISSASIVINHNDYDNLFVIKRNRCSNPDRYTLIRRTYGQVSP